MHILITIFLLQRSLADLGYSDTMELQMAINHLNNAINKLNNKIMTEDTDVSRQ